MSCTLVVLLLSLARPSVAVAWVLNGYSWPAGTDIVMRLQLEHGSGPLQDGHVSWNASAAAALTTWNQHIDTVRFVAGNSAPAAGGDGVSSVFFSDSIYGESFGPNLLAVTMNYRPSGNTFTETDVIFNNQKRWDSYRGPQQGSGLNATYDLHRVALHEFGHVLGLQHPDEFGQPNVAALMRSILSDLDHLTEDDIAGAVSLYRLRITSPTNQQAALLGSPFSYQITSSRPDATYGATGLPPGLEVDPGTGLISGTPNISGNYSVTISATFSGRVATAVLPINVAANNALPGAMVRQFDFGVSRLLRDPVRSRIYATVPATNHVAVIDPDALAVITMVPVGPQPAGMSLSPDGSRLWVANSGSAAQGLTAVDLVTLTPVATLSIPHPAVDVEAGLEGRLYVTSPGGQIGIMQIDSSTGALQASFAPTAQARQGFLEMSADKKTLYFGGSGIPGMYDPNLVIARYDVATETAVLLQQRPMDGNSGTDLKLSHDGRMLLHLNFYGNENPGGFAARTFALDPADVMQVLGRFAGTWPYTSHAAFSPDDAVTYITLPLRNRIAAFNSATFALLGTIETGTNSAGQTYESSDLVVSATGANLFVASSISSSAGVQRVFRVYATGRDINGPPPARKLLNLSTRALTRSGAEVMIGGFIITGSAPKTLALRAIGPSLPVAGRLPDPVLELRDSSGALVATNDNWNSYRQAILQAGVAPTHERESALLVTLDAGGYTAIVRDASGGSGIGLVEIFDLTAQRDSRLANVSTRGKVETGDAVMIGGFIVGGEQTSRVIVRAIGPSLAPLGVPGALSDTTLDLHDGNGTLFASNDDWQTHQAEEIIATTVPPTDPREAAIVRTLPAGGYTAIVRGKNGTTGTALVEVFHLTDD
ncbi:hypothetical protein BH20VER1_BH20VER1_25060 [soil metagenome]